MSWVEEMRNGDEVNEKKKKKRRRDSTKNGVCEKFKKDTKA